MAREMKDSGVEWIGEIPADWSTSRLKALFSFGKGLPITKDNLISEGLPVISYGQVHAKQTTGVSVEPHLIKYVSEDYMDSNPQSLVKQGDFIFADTSEDLDGCGNGVYIDRDMPLFAGYHTIIFKHKKSNNNKFLAYLFKTDAWRTQLRAKASGVKLFSISRKMLGESTVIFPYDDEQQKIVNFLDKKCSQIDTALEKTRTTIEEYKKFKQAIITKAVTKGIRGDRPMKDSGIEWIGEIPVEWGVPKLKYIAKLSSGGTPDRMHHEYWNGNIKWIKTGELQNNVITDSQEYITELALKNSAVILYKPDTILVAMYGQGKTRGMTAFLQTVATTNQACAGIVVKNKNSYSKFIWKYLIGSYVAIREKAQGSGQPNLNISMLADFYITLPSLEEQQEIADYLDKKCAAIDTLIAKKEQLITDLESYKKSLIYEYVTGKKEVN